MCVCVRVCVGVKWVSTALHFTLLAQQPLNWLFAGVASRNPPNRAKCRNVIPIRYSIVRPCIAIGVVCYSVCALSIRHDTRTHTHIRVTWDDVCTYLKQAKNDNGSSQCHFVCAIINSQAFLLDSAVLLWFARVSRSYDVISLAREACASRLSFSALSR